MNNIIDVDVTTTHDDKAQNTENKHPKINNSLTVTFATNRNSRIVVIFLNKVIVHYLSTESRMENINPNYLKKKLHEKADRCKKSAVKLNTNAVSYPLHNRKDHKNKQRQ